MSKSVVECYIDEASSERGVHRDIVRAVLKDFLRALHQADIRSGYFSSEGSTMAQVYWALGPEAAFHYVGLLARQGKGHDPGDVQTELQYLDQHAYRFKTTVNRWMEEITKEIADQE